MGGWERNGRDPIPSSNMACLLTRNGRETPLGKRKECFSRRRGSRKRGGSGESKAKIPRTTLDGRQLRIPQRQERS